MKQFVLKFENVEPEVDKLKALFSNSLSVLTAEAIDTLSNQNFKEVFSTLDLLANKSPKPDRSFKTAEPLSTKDRRIILVRHGSALNLLHYLPEDKSLLAYFSLSEDHSNDYYESKTFNLLECYTNIPEDIRSGKLMYSSTYYWNYTAYKRRLLHTITGESATLEQVKRLTVEQLHAMMTNEKRFKDLREAILHWVNNPDAVEIKTYFKLAKLNFH